MITSEGAQSTPQVSPAAGQYPVPVVHNSIAKLATATQVLLVASGVVSIAVIGVESFGIASINAFLGGDNTAEDWFDVYDESSLGVSALSVLLFISTGVLWLLWQYRVAQQFSSQTRRSPGWHVGSWFIPFINLWFPYQNLSDLWRAVGRTRPSWQILWWLLWLSNGLLAQVWVSVDTSAEDLETLRVSMWVNLSSEVTLLVATPMAWLIIRRITQGAVQRFSSNSVPTQ